MKYNNMTLRQLRKDTPIGHIEGKLTHVGGYLGKIGKQGVRRAKDVWECECGSTTIISPTKAKRTQQCHICTRVES
jgi:hypothetical protein